MAYVWGILLLIVGLALFAFAYWRWGTLSRVKKVEAVFHDREPLATKELFETYFLERGVPSDVLKRVRSVLETELEADLSRLRVNDDFSKELKFFWEYDSMAAVEILYSLEEEFKIKITDEEAEKMVTPDDIVTIVWEKVRAQEGTA